MPAFLIRDGYGNPMDPTHPSMRLRNMLGQGRYAEARALKAQLLEQFAGSVDIELLAGDVELLAGNSQAARSHYNSAAQVRTNWPLVRRLVLATLRIGDDAGARRMLAGHIAQNPREAAAVALLGRMQREAGNPARAAVLLRYAAGVGAGKSDPLLHAELAELEAGLGLTQEAQDSARFANGLQRSNQRVALALARTIELGGGDDATAKALLAKAAAGPTNRLVMR